MFAAFLKSREYINLCIQKKIGCFISGLHGCRDLCDKTGMRINQSCYPQPTDGPKCPPDQCDGKDIQYATLGVHDVTYFPHFLPTRIQTEDFIEYASTVCNKPKFNCIRLTDEMMAYTGTNNMTSYIFANPVVYDVIYNPWIQNICAQSATFTEINSMLTNITPRGRKNRTPGIQPVTPLSVICI